jgi:seryl-tRNA synthetase
MTLDVTSFIDEKGGNAQEVRESQKKRYASVELVDEVIQMYKDWVKSACTFSPCGSRTERIPVDFEANQMAKQTNAIQKEITAKRKVRLAVCSKFDMADLFARRKKAQMS